MKKQPSEKKWVCYDGKHLGSSLKQTSYLADVVLLTADN